MRNWTEFTMVLATTRQEPGDVNTEPLRNKSTEVKVVFESKMLSRRARGDGSFDLVFPLKPYRYNPSHGNLMLGITMGAGLGAQPMYLQAGPSPLLGCVTSVPNSPIHMQHPRSGLHTQMIYQVVENADEETKSKKSEAPATPATP